MLRFRQLISRFLPCKAKSRILTYCSSKHYSTNESCRECQGLRVLYFGSDAFSIGPLTMLVSRMRNRQIGKEIIEGIEVVMSESPLTLKGNKKQKPNEFLDYVKKQNLHIHLWNRDTLSKLPSFDFGVVASFGFLIPKKIIQMFKRGIINAHPSLLPRWHGAAPIIHTVLNGDMKTGVTIIDLSVGRFDKGKIFDQKEIDVNPTWTTEILTEELRNLAAIMVLSVIDDYDCYKSNSYHQSDEGATHAPKISTNISYINWKETSRDEIDRLHRAIGGKIGLHTFFEGKLVKLVEISLLNRKECNEMDEKMRFPFEPGRIWYDKKSRNMFVKCRDGWIQVSSLQMQYKKAINPADFYNAYMVDRRKTGNSKDMFYTRL